MKCTVLIFSIIFLSKNMIAQTKHHKCIDGPPAKSLLDKRYKGGKIAFDKFVDDNIVIPSNMKFREGDFVSFSVTINSSGDLISVRQEERINNCESCTEEVIRLIKLVSKWIPACTGKKGCKPYTFLVSIPFYRAK